MKAAMKWLEKFVEEFMFHDIKACIDGQANFAAALTLSAYTEAIGGLINGNLTERKNSERNYTTFLIRMGYTPEEAKRHYDNVRCGLVHRYFIKGEFTVAVRSVHTNPRGILEQNGVIYFTLETYFEEFRKAYFSYKNNLMKGKGDLAQNFDLALGGESLPYEVRSLYDSEVSRDMWPPVGGITTTSTLVFVPWAKPMDITQPDKEGEEP